MIDCCSILIFLQKWDLGSCSVYVWSESDPVVCTPLQLQASDSSHVVWKGQQFWDFESCVALCLTRYYISVIVVLKYSPPIWSVMIPFHWIKWGTNCPEQQIEWWICFSTSAPILFFSLIILSFCLSSRVLEVICCKWLRFTLESNQSLYL